MKFIFLVYRYVLVPLAWLTLTALHLFQKNKKWSHFYLDRRQNNFHRRHQSSTKNEATPETKTIQPIWIHAASGEIEYARPLIRQLKDRYPQIPILVTCTSRSSQNIINSLNEVDYWGPSPWDSVKSIQEFLNKWNPRILLISRTDLWPEMLYQCKIKNIPRILFSASFDFSHESNLIQKVKLYLLLQISTVFAVSSQDVANLKIRGISHVIRGGDTRYDQVFYRINNPKKLKNELKPDQNELVFIAGSTWPEDELQLVSAIAKLKIKSIIAPHETNEEHLQSLELHLKNQNIKFQRYSRCNHKNDWPNGSVLIIDQVGILAELYTWAHVAFVGGSFKKQVHSVMEPLAAGLFTLVGPFHSNNRESIEFQSHIVASQSLVSQVNNSHEIYEQIQNLLKIVSASTKLSIQSEVLKFTGATETLVTYLEKNFLN